MECLDQYSRNNNGIWIKIKKNIYIYIQKKVLAPLVAQKYTKPIKLDIVYFSFAATLLTRAPEIYFARIQLMFLKSSIQTLFILVIKSCNLK